MKNKKTLKEAIESKRRGHLMNLLMNKIEQNYRYLKSGKKSLVDICKSINVSPQDRRDLLRMANDAMNQYEDYRVSQYGFGMAGSDKEYKGRGDEFNYDMSDDDMMMESKKQCIRLTESELKNIIAESVKRVLRESEGKKKLQNSFKSKEDMTQYRDQYDPRGEDEGPYMRYHSTTFDDMDYDYCGDDMYNDKASEYNSNLKKRLATKGGQMSYDWDTEFGREASMAKNARQRLDADADEAYLRRMRDDEIGKHHMKAWVNGELDTDALDRYGFGWDDIDNTLSKQHMGYTPLRNKEIERQRGYRSYRPYEQTMDRKNVNKK